MLMTKIMKYLIAFETGFWIELTTDFIADCHSKLSPIPTHSLNGVSPEQIRNPHFRMTSTPTCDPFLSLLKVLDDSLRGNWDDALASKT